MPYYYRSKQTLLALLLPVTMGISSYLPFKWPKTTPPEPLCPDSTVPKKEYERIIQTLLHKVSYKHPSLTYRSYLKPKLENNLRALGLGEDLIQRHNGAAINTTICVIQSFYSHVPVNIQEIIAIFTALTVLTDDLAAEIRGPLQRYAGQLVKGEQHEHVLLTAVTSWLAQHARKFGVFGGNMLIKSTVDCISACAYEVEGLGMSNADARHAPDSAQYFRYKTGGSEGFAFLLFPEEVFPEDRFLQCYLPAIPYIIQYLDFANDVLSFYKEELNSLDRASFIHTLARSSGISPLGALKQTSERVVRIFQDIRGVIRGNAALEDAMERFLHGYLAFHLGRSRYRLIELDIPAVREAKELLKPRDSL